MGTAATRPLSLLAPALFLALGAGCGDKPRPIFGDMDLDSDSDSDGDSDSDTDSDSDSDTDSDSDSDGDTDTFDCDALPAAPISVEELVGPVAYHDLAFDSDGFIVGAGSGGSPLFKADVSSAATVWVSGVSGVQGMDYLPDGDLVALTDSHGLARITPEGTVTSIAASLSGYGAQVTVGPDGMVYAGDNATLYRVDPDTGEMEALATGIAARGCDFSPDFSRMYINTNDGSGNIFVADLDDDLNLVGAPTIFANIPGGGPWLDAVRVDACGNVYVPSYSMSNLSRITPEGAVSVFYQWSFNQYGHGIKWGSGIGGWDDTSIYYAQPYDGSGVGKMEVGVHYRE